MEISLARKCTSDVEAKRQGRPQGREVRPNEIRTSCGPPSLAPVQTYAALAALTAGAARAAARAPPARRCMRGLGSGVPKVAPSAGEQQQDQQTNLR